MYGFRAKKHCRLKAYKDKEHKHQFVVGHNANLDRVEDLSMRALIGRFEYIQMNKDDLMAWDLAHWKPLR